MNKLLTLSGLTAALLLSPAVMATPLSVFTYTNAFSSYYDNEEYRLLDENAGDVSSARVSAAPGDLAVDAYGSARFGVLKNVAVVRGNAGTGFVNAASTSIWLTRMTFSNAELTGQKGYATIKHFGVAGFAPGAEFGARSTATYTTGIGFSRGTVEDYRSDFDQVLSRQTVESKDTVFTRKQEFALIDETTDPYDYWTEGTKPFAAPTNYLYLPIEFIWGETYTVFATQTAECNLLNSTGGSVCTAHAGNSAYWGGVTDVRNEAGEQVTGFSLLSADGEDITDSLAPAEVPEPGSLALFGIALLGAAGIRRQRRA